MEKYYSEPLESINEPDKTGESNTSKRRGKRTTKIPLPITKSDAKESPKKQKDIPEELPKERPQEERTVSEELVPAETGLELPEVPKDEPEFRGELIITHEEQPEEPGENLVEAAQEEAVDPSRSEDTEVESSSEVPAPEPEAPSQSAAEVVPPVEESPTSEETKEAPPRVAPPLPFVFVSERPGTPPEAPSEPIETTIPTEPAPGPRPISERIPMIDPSLSAIERSRPIFKKRTEPVIPKAEANRQALRAEKRGLSRGVVTGGLVGWWMGRRGKRAVEREAQAAIESRDKAIERLVRERGADQEVADKRINVIKRTQEELRELMRRSWDNQVLRRKKPEVPPPAVLTNVEQTPLYETTKPVFEPEAPKAMPKIETKPALKPERAPEEKEITEETYKMPEGRRVETSAWHRIEIDEKTGLAVENPSVAYGEAYHQEKQQERLVREAAQAQAATQVGQAVLAGVDDQTAQAADTAKPDQASATRQSAVTSAQDDAAYIRQQLIRRTTSPVTWGIALLIVVLLFLTGILD